MALSKLGKIMAAEFRTSMLRHRLFVRWVVANRMGNKIKRIALKRVNNTIQVGIFGHLNPLQW
jgi:hypothetical protein